MRAAELEQSGAARAHERDATPAGSTVLPADAAKLFRENYNRNSFRFAHHLRHHSLLNLASLNALAARHPQDPGHAYWCNGGVRVEDTWDAGHRPPQCSLQETVANIATTDSLAIFKHVQDDEILGPLMRECFAAVIAAVGDRMRADVIASRGTVLLASPRRVTSYHIDADVNFLFQIAGDKSISVFDPNDRSLLTHQELERYHLGDLSGATFKSACNAGAAYQLQAGEGVHIPYTAPHWATTVDTPSVALSINFDLRSTQPDAALYRLNGKLRRFGLDPTPPGVSAWRDGVKLAALKGFRVIRMVKHRGNEH